MSMVITTILFGLWLFVLFTDNHSYWKHYIENEVQISKSLAALNKNIGYGGFIHNFKNLVLRKDIPRYEAAIDDNIIEVNQQLHKLNDILQTEVGRNALKDIRVTFEDYFAKYQVVKKMIRAGATPTEIDAVVKVDDTAALRAINLLSTSIKLRASVAETTFNSKLKDFRTVLEYDGLVTILFICFVTALLIYYLRKLFNINLVLAKEKTRAEYASASKTKFVSSISHELRTPMNAILGFAQLIKMTAKEELAKNHSQEIILAGEHLMELINELLDLSKIESGSFNLAIEDISLNKVMEKATTIIRPVATNHHIEIINNIHADNNFHIKADRVRFRQVLLNLLSNAVKYNQPHGKIIIDAEKTDDNKLCISITDTGKGLSAEQIEQLFIPFERAGAELSSIPGIGLGLVISKDILNQMGGDIGCDSEPGQGCRFWLTIPLA